LSQNYKCIFNVVLSPTRRDVCKKAYIGVVPVAKPHILKLTYRYGI